jgi:hypothetical protein
VSERIDVNASEDFDLVYVSQGTALVHNLVAGLLEVYSRSPGHAGRALVIDGEDYVHVREATANDVGFVGEFEDVLNEFLDHGGRERLVRVYQKADAKNQAILRYIEPRIPQWVEEWKEGTYAVREGMLRLYPITFPSGDRMRDTYGRGPLPNRDNFNEWHDKH